MSTLPAREFSLPLSAEAWRAVLARDSRYDGQLFYAVATTGVYCRPSCPSRRPLRQNVAFYATGAEAEAKGYRPCKRCRPNDDPDQADRRLDRVKRLIDANLDKSLTLDRLGRAVGLSGFHLQRSFKRQFGLSPSEYARARRTDRLKRELRDGASVSEATYEAGFGSSSRVYEQATGRLGMTPGAYRQGGKGLAIEYTTIASPLGRVLVGATTRGVCFVAIGDRDATLARELRAEYPKAALSEVESARLPWARALVDHLTNDSPLSDLPIDVRASAFQWRVWRALRQIPAGTTLSYSEVAARIGQPSAARAVARACATNPVPVLIPCHRVVRGDGSLGGYRWGVKRKETLLAKERESV